MSSYSLLAYLGPRLILQLENLATEALWYLLHTYTQANDAINSVVQDLGVHSTGGFDFIPQIANPEYGTPDLVGKNPSGDSKVLIECKFRAPLTINQPVGYLSQLATDSSGIVLFLIPQDRISDLWPRVKRRAKAARYSVSDPVGKKNAAFSVRVSPSARLGYVTWSFLLRRIKDELETANETLGLGELWQLDGLCRRLIEEPAPEPVSPIEKRAAQLRVVVDDLVAEMRKEGRIDTEGYAAGRGPGYYRRYGTVFGQLNWFVEYNENNAHQFGGPLLWLGCPFSAEVAKSLPMLREAGVHAEREGRNLVFPLAVSSESDTAPLSSLLAQVSIILEQIKPTRQDG